MSNIIVDFTIWVRYHSRSVKMIPFKSLGAVSYSPSIVTMAVSVAISDIGLLSVEEWPDLEILVWGRSRSLKMARFDRPCMTFYCNYSTICELFDVEIE